MSDFFCIYRIFVIWSELNQKSSSNGQKSVNLAKIYEIYRLILINSLLSEIYLLRQVLNWSPKIPSGWKSLVLFLFILLCRLIWNTVTDVFYGRRSWREILYNLYFTLLVYYPFKGLKNKKYSELGPNWQIFTYAYYPPTHSMPTPKYSLQNVTLTSLETETILRPFSKILLGQ